MTQRRDFLKRASLLAAGTLASGQLGAQSAIAPQPSADWDMSWTEKVTGKHRMCFDAPSISEGVCLHQARSFLAGYAAIFGLTDADLTAVLVIRHAAVPMVMGDELWADGAFGEADKLKDPGTGESTKRNPFINIAPGSAHALTWPDGALDTLINRGVIVLACDLALRNFSGRIASRMSIPRPDALQMVYRSIIPGVTRLPTGIFATSHAQSLGCGLLSAT